MDILRFGKIALYKICLFKNYASSATWPLDSISCAAFNTYVSTLQKVRNLFIIYYTLSEWMVM